MSQPHQHLSPDAIYPFDARGVAKRFRHASIVSRPLQLPACRAHAMMNAKELSV